MKSSSKLRIILIVFFKGDNGLVTTVFLQTETGDNGVIFTGEFLLVGESV